MSNAHNKNNEIEKNTQNKINKTGESRKKDFHKIVSNYQDKWDSIAKNFEMIQGAQLSNSFIILLALEENNGEPLHTAQISEIIADRTKGPIYKISATLKDLLEHRLKREGYVESIDLKNKSLYNITERGIKLLKGWISFLDAFE